MGGGVGRSIFKGNGSTLGNQQSSSFKFQKIVGIQIYCAASKFCGMETRPIQGLGSLGIWQEKPYKTENQSTFFPGLSRRHLGSGSLDVCSLNYAYSLEN